MNRKIELWGLAGFFVAIAWVVLVQAIPLYPSHQVLWAFARITCPILPVSLALHFGVKWYWFVASNIAAYALAGIVLEAFRRRMKVALRRRVEVPVL